LRFLRLSLNCGALNGEILKILLLLLAGAAVCGALHWLIGVAQRWLLRHGNAATIPADTNRPSLRKLFFDWTGNALRTLVWLVFFIFVIHVLPQTRAGLGGVGPRLTRLREQSLQWLLNQGINVIVVIVATIFIMRFATALIGTISALYERGVVNRAGMAASRRVQTLTSIFLGTVQTIIIFIGLMTLLRQLRVDVTPILASAGVVGLAIGFGAQSLIKDLFSGLLILLEDQFNVGDTVKIGDTTGTVEQLTLRATRVRALDGALTSIPNGTINTVSNLSRDWGRLVLDVEVDYAEDVDHAVAVMNETAKQLCAERPQAIIEEPHVLGVDKVSASALTLRLMVKTAPNKQGDVGAELRRRIKLAFDQAGIKAPASHQQLVLNAPLVAETEKDRNREIER
jgi:moderate conductance mechanosensitive channel